MLKSDSYHKDNIFAKISLFSLLSRGEEVVQVFLRFFCCLERVPVSAQLDGGLAGRSGTSAPRVKVRATFDNL